MLTAALDVGVDAALDLLLGSSCVGCATPGRLLCGTCAADLPDLPFVAWPSPTPAGLVTPWAAAPYDATVRDLVLGLKERRLLGLVRPLAGLLAGSVAAACLDAPPGPVVLVPVPSRPATVRARGHDPTLAMTARAARLLRGHGYEVTVARALRLRRRVRDQSGLDAAARAANLAGSMGCPSRWAARLRRRGPGLRAIVCDDVLTTGSTAREAQRALAASGIEVGAVATVAATLRRSGGGPGPHVQFSADRLSSPTGTD